MSVPPPSSGARSSKDDMVEKSSCIFLFLYNLIFKPYYLSSPLPPLQGKIDICPRGLFCPKFDAKKLLFEAFFIIMHIFGSVLPKNECNFPFLYKNIKHVSPIVSVGWKMAAVLTCIILESQQKYQLHQTKLHLHSFIKICFLGTVES